MLYYTYGKKHTAPQRHPPQNISSTPGLCSDCRGRRKGDKTKNVSPGEQRPAGSHCTDRPLGCQQRARPILLPPTPFLIFSFHNSAIKSNYSLVIFADSWGTLNECIKDRATQKALANSKPQHFHLHSSVATGQTDGEFGCLEKIKRYTKSIPA